MPNNFLKKFKKLPLEIKKAVYLKLVKESAHAYFNQKRIMRTNLSSVMVLEGVIAPRNFSRHFLSAFPLF